MGRNDNPLESLGEAGSPHEKKSWVLRPLVGLFICLALFVGAVYLDLRPEALDSLFSDLFPVLGAEVPPDEKGRGIKSVERKPIPSILGGKSLVESGEGGLSRNPKEMSYLWIGRKKELDTREATLIELETELQEQKEEIEKKIRYLEGVRSKVASMLKERVAINEEKVKKLVDFYSNMKPQNAAKIISRIDEDLAVAVLGKMKKLNAAEIMNRLAPLKAQKLSEKFAGYQKYN